MYTITVCTWTSHTVTVCSIYKLPLHFLSRQSLPVYLSICINPVHLDGQCLLPVYETKTNFLIYVQNSCDITLCSFLLFWIQTDLLRVYPQFPSNSPSHYPRHFLCSICVETECAMVPSFCSLWLLFFFIRGGHEYNIKMKLNVYFVKYNCVTFY